MLNTKYIIYNSNADPIINPYALGNAWFVNNVKIVQNADEEIGAIETLKPDSIAVADKRFESYLSEHPFQKSNKGKITLTDYSPNELNYKYNSNADQFAVFSEVYYKNGWHAFVDGKEMPYIRVDYILRGMTLPAGSHEVMFRFKPAYYYVGENISLVSSLIILLLVAGYLYVLVRKLIRRKQE